MSRSFAALVVLAAIVPPSLAAQQPFDSRQPFDFRALYTKQEVMIPMRDGVRLYTRIFVPKDTTRLHPFVMVRTPYGNPPYGADAFPRRLDHISEAYARENFIIVGQDVRGRWMSEGDFVNVRPYIENKSPRDVDETTDTYDTVEWLIHNVGHNNGRVGVRGTSYPGFYAEMAAIDAHPAVKVVSPQAPVTEWMGGDDFFHHGALLLAHSFFFDFFGRPRHGPSSASPPFPDFGTPDGYEYFLRLGGLADVLAKVEDDSVAYYDSLALHPTWDEWWAARSARPHLTHLRPAMLFVGGWFDTENLWGALNGFAMADTSAPQGDVRLVMGPWHHGQWNTVPGDSLGLMDWGSPTTVFYADSIEVPFFNYYLLDSQPAPRKWKAAVFETGLDRWHFVDAWPPPNAAPLDVYLRSGGELSYDPPEARGKSAWDRYTSDPSKPVPYTAEVTQWYDPAFMVEDQRFAAQRPDVLVYQTAPLERDLTVAGPVSVDFDVSTTGTDCDWIVKVIDVFPDSAGRGGGEFSYRRSPRAARLGGYEMLVRGDVLRGKFRGSMTRPRPFTPGAVTRIRFDMNDVYHTFRPGHRLMVQVQGSWFPMIDRNPGRFMDIWRATDDEYRSTTQRVYRTREYPSHVVLRVLPHP